MWRSPDNVLHNSRDTSQRSYAAFLQDGISPTADVRASIAVLEINRVLQSQQNSRDFQHAQFLIIAETGRRDRVLI